MRAAVYHGIGDIRMEETADVYPDTGEIIVRVHLCILCGSDLRTLRHGHAKVRPPAILGHEFAGTVDRVGEGVDRAWIGARVVVAPAIGCTTCPMCRAGHSHLCEARETLGFSFDGALAEYVRIPARAVRAGNVIRIPDGVDDADAALTEPLACVVNAQEALSIRKGDTVAVIGAGPLGILHAELARMNGAKRIFLLNRSRNRLDMARDAGYDAYIETGGDGGVQAVRELTEGRGADVVIVAVGDAAAQQAGIAMAAKMGKICLFAGLPKDAPTLSVDANIIHYRQLTIYGTFSSAPRHNAYALELIRSGRMEVRRLVTHIVPLEKIETAVALAEDRRGMRVAVAVRKEAET